MKQVPSLPAGEISSMFCEIDSTEWLMHENHELCSFVSFKSLTHVYFMSWTREMDPKEYEKIVGSFSDKKYPNDIKE